jgi:alginate O-acetyltransferase complex protein AlgJ
VWHLLPASPNIKAAEKSVEDDSIVAHGLRPGVQTILTCGLKAGTEQVYPGAGGWLFYRPDVDYVTGPPFLDARWLKQREHMVGHPSDPVAAILDFQRQLKTRGIELIVMPAPVKPSVEGRWLTAGGWANSPALQVGWAVANRPSLDLQNPSFADFKAQLAARGVRIFDPLPALRQRQHQDLQYNTLYLMADTHWRPETMNLVARQLTAFLRLPAPAPKVESTIFNKEISAVGDIARMLDLPVGRGSYVPETVTIGQVTVGNALWRPSRGARVLLLGDSFTNIYSLETMGWGEAAGFAEHLSHVLGEPVDTIVRNSDGAFATREILAQELARGRDRLAGKKWVIWEFAARELAFGNWKLVDLASHPSGETKLLSLSPGESPIVTATVQEISAVPRPGTVPYRDHVATMHLVDVERAGGAPEPGLEALACVLTMKDNAWTAAAHLRPGEHVKLRLRPWAEVSAQYEKINRSELDDATLQLNEPVWAEVVK